MKNSMLLAVCASVATFATVATGQVAPSEVVFDKYGAVAASLTGVAGDTANGVAVFKDRKKGNCMACHVNSALPDMQFPGEIGPPLDGVAVRWTEAELRGLLVNAKNTFDGTMMPAFYVDSGYTRILAKFEGKPNLTAQEVEDVLAYLQTLSE
ncbi:MAG: sulfur oxidation c-type cytochrome SoxX [Rhodobacteraceae bacterium]|nr:sulfur oxidation c-type cytochrome SoxX [Paracoccaceae bacterium]